MEEVNGDLAEVCSEVVYFCDCLGLLTKGFEVEIQSLMKKMKEKRAEFPCDKWE